MNTMFSTESDGFDREGDEGGRQTPCSNPQRDAFNDDGGGEMTFGAYLVGDPASMEFPATIRTLRKSYTVASNAAAEEKKKVLISKIPMCLVPLPDV
jgi:hypothetical protein